jgi:predicted oxidoreductase
MGRYRAIMTENDRDNIGGEGDIERHHLDQSVYRVRKRINEELAEDVDVLAEHRPDLLAELREVVCETEG